MGIVVDTMSMINKAYHFDDDFIERFDAPDDVLTAFVCAQQRQCHPKEHRNKYDAQQVHVCGCCSNVVRNEVPEQLQEGVYWGFGMWLVILKVPGDKTKSEALDC